MTMSLLPSVVRAEYKGKFRIHVTFHDSVAGTIDFRQWAYFRRFFIDGGTVAWPNGADIAPETLYECAVRKQPASKGNGRSSARRARN